MDDPHSLQHAGGHTAANTDLSAICLVRPLQAAVHGAMEGSPFLPDLPRGLDAALA